MSKFNYPQELWDEDGKYWALIETFTKGQAIEQSKMYEDDSVPFGEPKKVFMREKNPIEQHYVRTTENNPLAVAYWEFEPQEKRIS